MVCRLTDCGIVPDAAYPQTEAIQKILDLCRNGGGTVVFPKGTYHIAGLLLHSDTTVYLESGAVLLGSENCNDYALFDVPENVELRTDMELIPQYFGYKKRTEYRRAMLSAYGAENISILGEPGAVIDGQNCFDPDGEEHYRGPHGIFLSGCRHVTLRGYTVRHSGNFMHQLDACADVSMTDVTCLGGSDGIHLHCCENVEIARCVFRTGDDCIAGINVRNLHVDTCVLNSSCQAFRIGGVDLTAENCHVYGPGYYPHRVTVVKSETEILPRELMYLNIPVIKLQPGSFKTQLTNKIYEDFDRAIASTNYYKKILTTMKPMMTMELGLDHDPKKLAKKLMLALNSRLPRTKYKVCTGKLLLTLELLPDKVVDLAYKAVVH